MPHLGPSSLRIIHGLVIDCSRTHLGTVAPNGGCPARRKKSEPERAFAAAWRARGEVEEEGEREKKARLYCTLFAAAGALRMDFALPSSHNFGKGQVNEEGKREREREKRRGRG